MNKRQYWLLGIPLAIFIFGILLAFMIKEDRIQANTSLIRQTAQLKLDDLSTEMVEGVRRYEYGLRGLKAAIDAVGFEEFNYQEQLQYFKSRNYPKEFPGARGFGLIKKVNQKDLAAFLAKASADRARPFRLQQLSDPKDPLFIIQYIEPELNNAQAVGLDIGSEPARRLAALQSATTGSTHLTAPITLVQAANKQKHGFLLLNALMKEDAASGGTRLLGWVYAPLLINEIIDSVVIQNGEFQIEIADTTVSNTIDFYQSVPENDLVIDEFMASIVVEVFGRQWQIQLIPTQKFVDKLALADAETAFWQMLVLSLLCAVLSFGLVHFFQRRLAEIRLSHTLAAVVDSTSDGIVSVDKYFAITSWNQAAELLFNFDSAHALGKPLANWFNASLAPDTLMQLFKQVAQGEVIKQFPLTYKADDSSAPRHLTLNISPLFVNKTFSGATLVLFDSTTLVQLQNKLIHSNKELQLQVQHFKNHSSMQQLFEERIVNLAHIAMIFCDTKGVISKANPMISALLGYDSEKLEGCNIAQLLVAAQSSGIESDPSNHLLTQLKTKGNEAVDVLFTHQSGKHISVQLNIIPLHSETINRGYVWLLDDLTEKKDMQRHVKLIQSAVENAREVMLWLNQKGEIFYSNPYATLALNIKPSRLKGMNVRSLLFLDQADDWDALLERIVQGGLYTFEARLKKMHDSFVPKLVSGCAIELDGQHYIYLAAKDITDRLEKEKKIELAMENVAAASAAKSEFIANMSNEFKTPLHAINGYLQLIGHTTTEHTTQDYVNNAKSEVTKLNHLLDDTLTVSDFYSTTPELNEADFELDELLADVGRQLHRMAGEKAVEVYFDVEEDVSFFFHADGYKFKQILLHIAGNAVKFTTEGEVTIHLSQQRLDQNDIRLCVSVKDTGIGIEPEQLQRIFQMFSQVSGSEKRKFKGLGLGLTIADKFTHLMQGSIQVQSTLGLGSEFSFDVRVHAAKSLSLPARCSQAETPVHVLLVDDNTTSLKIMKEIVSQLNWKATLASNAADALTLLQSAFNHQEPFDLVLLDWLMPEMDGLELAEMIRKIAPVHQVPVLILVTAHKVDSLAVQCEKRPELLNGFLTKPVTRSQIIEAFFDAVAPSRHQVFHTVIQPDVALLKGTRILLVEDNPTNQHIASELLALHGAVVTVAASGKEALAVLDNSLVRFDLVLMDIQMPGMDGYETTQHIKNKESLKYLPVIAVTASGMVSEQKKCFEAGMVGHIVKPFELTDLVQKILDVRRNTDQAVEPGAAVVVNSTGFNDIVFEFCQQHQIDISSALARFNQMTKVYVQSLALLIADLDDYKVKLAAGDCRKAELKLVFHTLKSTSASLGFNQLAEVAKAQELAIEAELDEATQPQTDFAEVIQQLETTRQLAEQLSQLLPEPQAARGRTPGGDFMPAYNQLKAELNSFNMQAMQSIQTIEPELRFLSPQLFDKLNQAMNALKFREAGEILKQYDVLIERGADAN
ncbi:response regulator [Rheinheimera mangrovi]|uniref:response regulator n=1 Tax=Rheinheimera mangrovi TaxID=2498451 RepID=UPI000F8DB284|nr:response regulator [Rheinheimera mangrovi]